MASTDNRTDIEEVIKQLQDLRKERQKIKLVEKAVIEELVEKTLGCNEVISKLGASLYPESASIDAGYDIMNLSVFPKPVFSDGGGFDRWLESDIDDFIAGLKALAPKDGGAND